MRRGFPFAILAASVALAWCVHTRENASRSEGLLLFSATLRGCPIFVPARPLKSEERAAQWLQQVLAKSSGHAARDFPILSERSGGSSRAIHVGATASGTDFLRTGRSAPYDTAVGMRATGRQVFIRSERRESAEMAVGWFLETQLGAHWFVPGPLGEVVPSRQELRLATGEHVARPGFLARELGAGRVSGAGDWVAQNRLLSQFEHQHNLANIFRAEDLRRVPEMAPLIDGQRFFPATGDQSWQPNLLSAAAIRHAADVAKAAFRRDPAKLSFSLCVNDSVAFDGSVDTLAAVAPARFFRHRPDYSNLVFRFTNDVAAEVRRLHPTRWLSTCAYYWCENVPDFPIAPNVLPYLCADRSRWSFPEFAEEDRALIERWCRSGAALVGVYEYLEGAPYLVPRPLHSVVATTIPFEFRAGVRAYCGEGQPNWGFDGAKSWLAAQLLWDPTRDPQALLDLYYREFWREASGPMREFFEVCDEVWRHQSGPPLWLRYYADEDQASIFSGDERARLRRCVTAAETLARTAEVRERVGLASAALSVTEAFCRFHATRAQLSRSAGEGMSPPALFAAWKDYRQARADFTGRYDAVRRERPLAVAAQELDLYLRNQPDSRAAAMLARTDAGRAALHADEGFVQECLQASAAEISELFARGTEVLVDSGWTGVGTRFAASSTCLDWTEPGASWRGGGEPWEGRTVELVSDAGRGRVLRMAGCRTEGLGQWAPAMPGALYAATVNVRAQTSPGTATFLIVSFLDDAGKHIGIGTIDRLPAGDGEQRTQLCVIARAPAAAKFIGFGVRVLNQVNDDFAEFSGASLRFIR